MSDFQTLVKERRSASNFEAGYAITEKALMQILRS
jgi:hypothetical protein